jgi:anti-sigma B factor antagonist
LQSLEINVTKTSTGVPAVRLTGEIDLHTCPELRATLQRLTEQGERYAILDMAEVPYLDSAALGVLVDAQRRAKDRDGELLLARVTPFVLRAFEITRLIRIFQVFPTVEEATAAVARQPGSKA